MNIADRYICIKRLTVMDMDEDGAITGKPHVVPVGAIYTYYATFNTSKGGLVALRKADSHLDYIEIYEETLAEYFHKMEV